MSWSSLLKFMKVGSDNTALANKSDLKSSYTGLSKMTCNSPSSTWQKGHWRSSCLSFSYLPEAVIRTPPTGVPPVSFQIARSRSSIIRILIRTILWVEAWCVLFSSLTNDTDGIGGKIGLNINQFYYHVQTPFCDKPSLFSDSWIKLLRVD